MYIYEILIFFCPETLLKCVSGWLAGCTVAVAVTASVGESIPADSLCGLPKWWRAAQPLLTPKLQGTKTTNKSKSGPGAGVGGGGLGVVSSLGGSTPPALLSLTKSARPGAAKSASAGPQGAPRRLPWRWWDIPSSLILQRTSVDLVSSFQPARKNDQWQCQNGPLPLSCQSPLLSQAKESERKVTSEKSSSTSSATWHPTLSVHFEFQQNLLFPSDWCHKLLKMDFRLTIGQTEKHHRWMVALSRNEFSRSVFGQI